MGLGFGHALHFFMHVCGLEIPGCSLTAVQRFHCPHITWQCFAATLLLMQHWLVHVFAGGCHGRNRQRPDLSCRCTSLPFQQGLAAAFTLLKSRHAGICSCSTVRWAFQHALKCPSLGSMCARAHAHVCVHARVDTQRWGLNVASLQPTLVFLCGVPLNSTALPPTCLFLGALYAAGMVFKYRAHGTARCSVRICGRVLDSLCMQTGLALRLMLA